MVDDDRSPLPWLFDIIAWSERLQRHIDGFDEDRFMQDETVQDAVARCAGVIGEAASKLRQVMPDVDERFPNFELRQAYALRNRLAHAYAGIDYRILWRTATRSIPPLLAQAKDVFAQLSQQESGSLE